MSSQNAYRKSKIQDYKCFYCGIDLIPFFPNQKTAYPDNATKDHIIPKSEYVKKLYDKYNGLSGNIVIACSKCNCERSSESFITFFLKKRGI